MSSGPAVYDAAGWEPWPCFPAKNWLATVFNSMLLQCKTFLWREVDADA
jgi:hypothetical protein